jgi:hypothetical protein
MLNAVQNQNLLYSTGQSTWFAKNYQRWQMPRLIRHRKAPILLFDGTGGTICPLKSSSACSRRANLLLDGDCMSMECAPLYASLLLVPVQRVQGLGCQWHGSPYAACGASCIIRCAREVGPLRGAAPHWRPSRRIAAVFLPRGHHPSLTVPFTLSPNTLHRQVHCGGCWSFATTSTLASRLCIESGGV